MDYCAAKMARSGVRAAWAAQRPKLAQTCRAVSASEVHTSCEGSNIYICIYIYMIICIYKYNIDIYIVIDGVR